MKTVGGADALRGARSRRCRKPAREHVERSGARCASTRNRARITMPSSFLTPSAMPIALILSFSLLTRRSARHACYKPLRRVRCAVRARVRRVRVDAAICLKTLRMRDNQKKHVIHVTPLRARPLIWREQRRMLRDPEAEARTQGTMARPSRQAANIVSRYRPADAFTRSRGLHSRMVRHDRRMRSWRRDRRAEYSTKYRSHCNTGVARHQRFLQRTPAPSPFGYSFAERPSFIPTFFARNVIIAERRHFQQSLALHRLLLLPLMAHALFFELRDAFIMLMLRSACRRCARRDARSAREKRNAGARTRRG